MSRIWRISLDPNLRKWDICVAETSRHELADDEAQRMSRRRPSISTQPRLCSSAALVSSSRAASSSSFSAASFSACCLKRKTRKIFTMLEKAPSLVPILTSHSRRRVATGLAPPSRTSNSPSAIAALILRWFYVNNEVESPNKYTKYQPKCLTFWFTRS